MLRTPNVVHEGATIEACALQLRERPLGVLVVVDRHGALIGALPGAEVALRGFVRANGTWMPRVPSDRALTARDLMCEASTVDVTGTTAEALAALLWTPDRFVVVTERGHPVGCVSAVEVCALGGAVLDPHAPVGPPTGPPPALRPSDPVDVALKRLDADRTDAFVVVNLDRTLVGVVERPTLIAHSGAQDRKTAVVDVLEPVSVRCGPGTSLATAARRMGAAEVGAIAIVNGDQRVRDLITVADLCYALLDRGI